MKHITRSLLVGIAAIALTAPADAVTYIFSFTGAFDASWQLPASPSPVTPLGAEAFRVTNVSMIIDGAPITDFHEYYVAASGGGICAGIFCSVIDLFGPQLFSGPLDAPTFLLGSFDMTNFGGQPLGTLTISVIPEPATWGLMIAGFGAVGLGLRRRRELASA